MPNDWLTGYAPGQPPDMFKPGQAKLIPAGSDIVLEVHYMPEGKATTDQSRLGLVLAKEPPTERAMTLSAGNSSFKIPPGDPNFRVDASYTMPEDVTLLGMHPHMHMRGKSAQYRIVFADGRTETLLNVPHYNWHWQLWYDLAEPIKLPKGTKLECTEHFDNSRNNPENPDPTKTVIWGQQSFDEMMVCMFNVTFDARITTRQMLAPAKTGSDGDVSSEQATRPDDQEARAAGRGSSRCSHLLVSCAGASRSQNIGTGQQPMAVAVNETTNKAYIVNHNSNSVTVIDGKTRTAIATIKTGVGAGRHRHQPGHQPGVRRQCQRQFGHRDRWRHRHGCRHGAHRQLLPGRRGESHDQQDLRGQQFRPQRHGHRRRHQRSRPRCGWARVRAASP